MLVNHFKSKFVDPRQANTMAKKKAARKKADNHRGRQADRVIKLLKERFPGTAFDTELFAVVGDLNDEPASKPLKKLLCQHRARGRPRADPEPAGPLDALVPRRKQRLAHRRAAALTRARPSDQRDRPGDRAARDQLRAHPPRRRRRPKAHPLPEVDDDPSPIDVDFRFPRFPEVDPELYASDHCPVFLDIPD